ncbi:phosphate ABC transporter substrate-binding protein, PhoT family [Nitrosomonas aestuarii]|uniref:Phosphate ABC transporter substrate-binding protein, PhoT family n=1 Tax=Nitrosomonas aestuarii TaxID=52441 RepID=A0A1I4H4I8_9PROT|nr:phosphate ABC transporter substrate-binding protein [Nitrosomonas aestuarii]SFL36311.1 phosphate ABC transporter substrate-binding protein, PhoT family [Nitrosomonas aestuarii]
MKICAKYLLINLFCLIIWASWLTSVSAASQRLIVTGSSTVAPLMSEIARRFELQYPEVRIDVQTGGSSRGINDVRRGIADIGMVSRALKPNENDLHAFSIAMDGIGIIVHANNPVISLNSQQIADIYTGKITHWKSVGGPNARITVVNKAEGRSTLELFLDYLQLKNSAVKPHIIIGDNTQGIKTVTGNPHAIGYVSIGAAAYEAQRGAPIRLLALNGVTASVENVYSGIFPLSRPLNLITPRVPQGLIRAFIEFARSSQLHHLIEAHYFVPIDTD